MRCARPSTTAVLPDPGLAHEHGVVLGATREDLHDPLDLRLAPDDRVELVFLGVLGQVASELVENLGALAVLGLAAGTRGGPPALPAGRAGKHPHDFLAHPVGVDLQVVQNPRRHSFAFPDQSQQDVFGPDIVVSERQGLAQRPLEHLLGPGREGDLSLGLVVALTYDAGHLSPHLFKADLQSAQNPGRDSIRFAQQPEEQVLRPYVVVAQDPSLLLGQNDHLSGSLCEPFKHHFPLWLPHARTGEYLAQQSRPDLIYLRAFQAARFCIQMIHHNVSRL